MDAIDQAMQEMGEDLSKQHETIEFEAEMSRALCMDESWVIDFFMNKMADLASAEAMVNERHKFLLNQIQMKRRALETSPIAMRFKDEADRQLKLEKSKRSIDGFFGRFGYRKTGGSAHVVFLDEAKALVQAKAECPEAVKVKESLLKKPLQEYMEAGGCIDGAELVQTEVQDQFYIKPATLKLESKPEGD